MYNYFEYVSIFALKRQALYVYVFGVVCVLVCVCCLGCVCRNHQIVWDTSRVFSHHFAFLGIEPKRYQSISSFRKSCFDRSSSKPPSSSFSCRVSCDQTVTCSLRCCTTSSAMRYSSLKIKAFCYSSFFWIIFTWYLTVSMKLGTQVLRTTLVFRLVVLFGSGLR